MEDIFSNGSKVGLSARGGHYVKRDECMAMFVDIYGYNPLLWVQLEIRWNIFQK